MENERFDYGDGHEWPVSDPATWWNGAAVDEPEPEPEPMDEDAYWGLGDALADNETLSLTGE
jgi:hypothetical protein